MKTRIIIFSIIFFSASFAFSQSTSVEFRVNMNYLISEGQFLPDTETVDIAGTFNGWGSTLTSMTDSDSDGIYIVSVTLTVGTNVEFKFRINGQWNGREEFPNAGPNRSYTVEQDGVVEFWYSDLIPSTVLDVKISSSNIFAEVDELIFFFDVSSGEPVSWNWSFPGGTPSSSTQKNPVISYAEEGDFNVTLEIGNGEGETLSKTFSSYIRVGQRETFWWNDAVFYEVFVRSFMDSDGDGKGDIRGLIEKLDYLNDGNPYTTDDLGITGIWLMPIQQSPSYHGYDATDFRTIEQDYGTNADFKYLIQEAHARGIKVIIDYVMNHTSNQHPWFTQSANSTSDKRDWYVWRNSNPGFSGPWGQTVWHYRNGSYFYGLFWSGMPDLNYANPDVKEEMFDIARFWLEEMNVDGFRLDAVKYIYEDGSDLENLSETIEFWKEFRSFYKDINPDAFSVGEAWASTSVVMPYVNDQALDYCFEFELSESIMNAVHSGSSTNLSQAVLNVLRSYPYMQFGTFLTNHDMNRVMSVFGTNEAKAKLAATLLLTLPGIPYIYYGEEIGMIGAKPDEYIRTPMQWTSSPNAGFTQGTPWIRVNSDYTERNVASQKTNPNSLWNLYRNLIQIRNAETPLRRGNYKPVSTSSSQVFAFVRQYSDDNILVVSNLGVTDIQNLALQVPITGISSGSYKLSDLLEGTSQVVSLQGEGLSSFSLDLIPAQTTRIFKLQGVGTNAEQIESNPIVIKVYPVPASEYLNIAVRGDVTGVMEYKIFNLMGNCLNASNLNHKDEKIWIGGLQSGVYLIEIKINGFVRVERFIVN
jgi:alpha-amylase